jgi:hypothetical protein
MKEKRKAMYGTLEFISNVPYYGIFTIKPGGVRLLLISSVSCWVTAVILIKQFDPPPPGVACHLVLAHSITGAQTINTCQKAAA